MRIDLIGGSGFIGTCLAGRLLAAGHDVRIIDKEPSHAFPDVVTIGDVRSVEEMRRAIRPETVIVNLAAEHRDDVRPVSLYREVNLEGMRNILSVATEHQVRRVVFTSSVAVYGFAPVGTDENGAIAPFNDYGRTKHEAEELLRAWHRESPQERMLAIVRPTVVFGERNRGNVFNLLRQIASGKFIMIGDGKNRKSIAYVENVAAFLEKNIFNTEGYYCYNYVDMPNFTMNELVSKVYETMGKSGEIKARLPYWAGLAAGKMFDAAALLTHRKFAVSSIRIKKFCANSVYNTSISSAEFSPPVPLDVALKKTITYEFIENHSEDKLFFTE
jgi:nucleoside-diphosphate-sugar epimerase